MYKLTRNNETDAKGFTRHKEYDLFGNVIKSYVGNHQNERSYQYDANNQVTLITNESLKEQQIFTYDELGHQLSKRNKTNQAYLVEQMLYDYDNRGNVIKTVDASNNETRFVYNEANKIDSKTDAMGNLEQWNYDSIGQSVFP